jgi:hypothetical protein
MELENIQIIKDQAIILNSRASIMKKQQITIKNQL